MIHKNNIKLRHIILHVGLPKTASTSIQETLFNNRTPSLLKKGYFPWSWDRNHSYPFSHFIHDECKPALLTKNKYAEYLKDADAATECLLDELSESSCETLILSTENLSFCSASSLKSVKKLLLSLNLFLNVNITVVFYVRSPSKFFTSLFQQFISNGLPILRRDLEKLSIYVSTQVQNIEKFAHVFGQDNIRVVKFEDACQHDFGPVGYFYEHFLHFERSDLQQIDFKKENLGSSQIAIDSMLFINERRNISMVGDFQKCQLLTPEQRKDYFIIKNAVTGHKFQLTKAHRLAHLERSKSYIEHLKNTHAIEYSAEQIKAEILSKPEPQQFPNDRNLHEIKSILPQVSLEVRQYLTEYLNARTETI